MMPSSDQPLRYEIDFREVDLLVKDVRPAQASAFTAKDGRPPLIVSVDPSSRLIISCLLSVDSSNLVAGETTE
jgi:hypothetical protein